MNSPISYKSFDREEYKLHISRMQSAMKAENIDALLLTMPENIYYATGYRTWYSSSLFRPVFCVIGQEGEPFLILRILEKTTAQLYAWTPNIICWGSNTRRLGNLDAKSPREAIRVVLSKHICGTRVVGLEAGDGLHYYSSLNTLEHIIDSFSDMQFRDGTPAIRQARMIKTPWEISRIREACSITEASILEAGNSIVAGKTSEKDLARSIAANMAQKGIDKISYLTVISGSEKASTFNAYASDRIICPGDVVLVDISGHVEGYASDLTRMFYMGAKPPEDILSMAEASLSSIIAGAQAFRPGVTVSEINRICEDALRQTIYKDYIVRSSGHGIGLNVVEYPIIEDDGTQTLEAGMVFAVEQGVYPYDLSIGATSIYSTMRHEDEVLMTVDGHEFLSGPGEAIYAVR